MYGYFLLTYQVKEIVDTLNGVSLGEEGIATASYSFVADTHLELSFSKVDSHDHLVNYVASLHCKYTIPAYDAPYDE